MIRAILLSALLAAPAAADGYDDPHRKSPKPLPPRKESCLKVRGFARCIPIAPHILRLYKLNSGDTVPPSVMFDIDEENRAFLRAKLR